MDWNRVYRELRMLNWISLFILSSFSYLFMSHSFTLGIILGGLVIIANFNALQHTVRAAFSPEGHMVKRKWSIILKYYFRLLVLGLILFFLVSKKWIHPVGLTLGLSIVVISIFSFGVMRALKIITSEAT